MDLLKQPLAELNAHIEALDLRGRVLVLLAGLALIYGLTALAVMPLLQKSHDKMDTSISVSRQKLTELGTALKSLESAEGGQSEAAVRAKVLALQAKQAEENARRATLSSQLVPASEMTALVEGLLANNRQVEVLALQNAEPTPVDPAATDSPAPVAPTAAQLMAKVLNPAASAAPEKAPAKAPVEATPLSQIGVYKHVLTIEVKGRYWDIARFLKSLEDQPKKILWGEVKLVTESYPFSTAAITIYTLNLDSAWIAI